MKLYDENVLSETQLMVALPSVIIGIAIFSLPSQIASVTTHSDGWVPILITGILFTLITILSGRFAANYQGKTFLSYATPLISKPIAVVLTFIFGVVAILLVAYIARSLAFISQQYLFAKTPMEVLVLCFLLVVIYAVAGTRAGIFRLNMLFLPIILLVYMVVVLFNVPEMSYTNFLPLFKTDIQSYGKGMIYSIGAFSGAISLVLFYTPFIKKPKSIAKIVLIGVGLPTIFNIIIFLTSIGIFGHAVTSNLNFPTVEIAKRANIPGGIFERVDALVFTIWIMSIFNSAAITYDIAVLQLGSLFNIKKPTLVFIIAPIIFYIAMFPQTLHQVTNFSNWLGYSSVAFNAAVVILLVIISKFRGQKDVKG